MTETKAARKSALNTAKILDFLTFTAAQENFSGAKKHVYTMQPDGAPILLRWYKQDDFSIADAVNHVSFVGNRAYYITKNSYCNGSRGDAFLLSLDNIVIDCDAHGAEMTDSGYKYECSRLLDAIEQQTGGNIPAISAVTYSGRGLHLWIRLESFPAKCAQFRVLYQIAAATIAAAVQRICGEIASPFTVDTAASTNASGLIRCGCTVNQSSGRMADFEIKSFRRISIDELQELAAVNMDGSGRTYQRKHGEKMTDEAERRRKYAPLNAKRLKFIHALLDADAEQDGRRDLLVFAYCNAHYSLTADAESAKAAALRINTRFSNPLKQTEVCNLIKSIFKVGGYDYKLDTFFTLISATETERILYASMSDNSREEERKARREAKKERDSLIFELRSQGFSLHEIAKNAACSSRTVERVLEKGKKGKYISAVLSYSQNENNSEGENGESKPESEPETVNEESKNREPVATATNGVKLYPVPEEQSADAPKRKICPWADELAGIDTRAVLAETQARWHTQERREMVRTAQASW